MRELLCRILQSATHREAVELLRSLELATTEDPLTQKTGQDALSAVLRVNQQPYRIPQSHNRFVGLRN
eukprot:m.368831 g.368831  ORF g.368831 m.368831 type:complete len:68 (-) comp16670_c0_seq3:1120-1323(-)